MDNDITLSRQEQRELHDALVLLQKRFRMQLWLITFMLDNIKDFSRKEDKQ